ncbi:hypothetical protein EDB87DRAFT_1416546 [Lactarius vividus]|nr:hypothetical protein EDB87DRAFT_1416546 [Lactarius vividus]
MILNRPPPLVLLFSASIPLYVMILSFSRTAASHSLLHQQDYPRSIRRARMYGGMGISAFLPGTRRQPRAIMRVTSASVTK